MAIFDTDRDGVISETEVDNASSALRKLDENKNGTIEPEEVQPRGMRGGPDEEGPGGRGRGNRARGERGPGQGQGDRGPDSSIDPAERVERLFSRYDTDEDGRLSGEEIPERLSRMMERADTSGDGALDRDEVEDFMSRRGGAGGGRPGRGGPEDGQRERPPRPEFE